jgi:SAM-dependent methyltransferase
MTHPLAATLRPGTRCLRRADIQRLSSEGLVRLFWELVRDELTHRRAKGLDADSLRSYYRNLFGEDGRVIPLGAHGYAGRVVSALECLRATAEESLVLDAGSGYGTESLLFSTLGKRVVGVELVSARVELARSRVAFFRSVCDFPLDVEFVNANVLRFLGTSQAFDVIWAMEAVSHIYPAEDFFRMARDALKPGGRLIVSDPNRINPLAWARSVRIRGSLRHVPHRRFDDPETGRPVDYGQERVFSVFQLKRHLARVGFIIEASHVSGFLGTSLLPPSFVSTHRAFRLLSRVQAVAKRSPVVKHLGTNYVVVARRPTQP